MTITLNESDAQCTIRLQGSIDIALAGELKKFLIQALASEKELNVDMECVTELDVTSLQLLWAAARQATGSGTRFTLANQLPEAISAAIADAGIEGLLDSADIDRLSEVR